MRIFHIAEPEHWEAAQVSGSYLQSTLGLTLADEDFIHCSREDQREDVLENYCAGHLTELVLLEIDTELLNRDPLLRPVRGIFAAQEIRPQAKVLAGDRGILCATVDYNALRGLDDPTDRLF